MSRSVSTPSSAHLVVFTHFESDDDPRDDFQYLVDELRNALCRRFPSVTRDDH